MALKLKIKKTLLKRKVEGVTKEGYYGRVITNGTKSFEDIVEQARLYIHTLGGFEKFAEWGLIRPLAQE